MNRKSFFIRTLGAAAALAAVTLCSFNARAEIVFGNLGPTGTSTLSETSTSFGPTLSTLALAQGFTTGTSNLTVQSITLGLSATGTVSRTVSLYSDASLAPSALLFTSSPVQVGDQNKYTFNFSGADLAPGTSYWIVPEAGSRWYLNFNETPPAVLNASGYAYLGTKRQTITSPGTWVNSSLPYSVSIEAVPEPSSLVMAGLGIGGLAMLERTRRRRQARLQDAVDGDDYLG